VNSKFDLSNPGTQELFQRAKQAREKAYSPYSGYQVGAAIKTTDGDIYTGCNIENSSFGATVCAERVAIQKAISEKGRIEIKEVMVVTQASPPWPPCGICRQVIAEFGAEITIHTANLAGEIETVPFKTIFPQSFNPTHLKK
jgi:cytidine deaminase